MTLKIEIVHVADVQIHMRSGSVERGGLRRSINGRRLGMLVSLAMNVGQVVTKDQLWGASHETARCSLGGGGRDSVRSHLNKLRNDLVPLGLAIETVQGFGYRLVVGEMPDAQSVPQPVTEAVRTPADHDIGETVGGLMARRYGLQAIARITGRSYAETAAAMERARNCGRAA